MIIPGFIGPSYVSSAKNVSAQTLYNWYPQSVEVGNEPSGVVYYPTPGKQTAYVLTAAPARALFEQDGRCFAVGGQILHELFDTGVVTVRGTLSGVDTNPATINSNGVAGGQLYITSGGLGDIYDLTTNTLSPILSAGYPANTPMGTYLDSYFLTIKGDSAQFNISDILDGTSWSALDFAVRTDQSDNLVGILQNNKIVWLIGSQTSEPWYDSGAASFPFSAVPQIIVPMGTCAPFSLTRLNTSDGSGIAAWLHKTARGQGHFVAAQSYQPQRISKFAQESDWASYPTMTDAVSYCYSDQGHDFCVVNFPDGNATWVYDFSEKQWHRRSWWNAQTANHDRDRGWVHCFAFDKHLVGDWETGEVHWQDTTLVTDNDLLIMRERQSGHMNAERKMLFFSEFQLDFDTGLGTSNGDGSAPMVNLSWSNDGGYTFGSEIEMNAGVQGDYGARCRVAGNLGSGRNRVWRIRANDPIPYRGLLQAYCNVTAGTS